MRRGPLRGARLLVRASQWAPLPRRAGVGEGLTIRGTLSALGRDTYGAELRRRGVAGELYAREAHPDGRRRGASTARSIGAAPRRDRGGGGHRRGRRRASARHGPGRGRGHRPGRAPGLPRERSAHLLAVSGQNVVLLAALALPVLALAGLGARARLLGLLLLTALYVPLAGAGPALQRAGVMGAAGIAATAASRPASGAYALLLAAVVTLAVNPRAAGDPGWQLSFAAVAGIIVLSPPLRRGLASALDGASSRRGVRPRAGPGAGGRVAHRGGRRGDERRRHGGHGPASGAPLRPRAGWPDCPRTCWRCRRWRRSCGWEWRRPRWVSSRVRARPWHRWRVRRRPPSDGWRACSLAYLSWTARAFADVPGGVVTPPVRSPATLALAYGLLLAAWAGASRVLGRGRDRAQEAAGAWRRLPRTRRTAVVAMAGAALLLALGHLLGPPRPPHALTVRFLDVGQGDATLIQDPSGAAILFDAGPPEAAVAGACCVAPGCGASPPSWPPTPRATTMVGWSMCSITFRSACSSTAETAPAMRASGRWSRRPTARDPPRGARRAAGLSPRARQRVGCSLRRRGRRAAPEDPNPRGIVAVVSSGDFDLLLSADAESVALLPLDAAGRGRHEGPPPRERRSGPSGGAGAAPARGGGDRGGEGEHLRTPDAVDPPALARAGTRTFRTDRDGTVSVTVENGEMRVDTEH